MPPLSLVPLLPFTVSLVCGILFRGIAGDIWWAALPLTVCVAGVIAGRAYLSVLSLGVAVGFIMAEAHRSVLPYEITDGRTEMFSGVVREQRECEGGRMVVLEVDSCGMARCGVFKSRGFVPSVIPQIDVADRMRFSASMRHLAENTDLPDEVDYNASLRMIGVVAEAFVAPDSIRHISHEPGLLNNIRRARADVQRSIALASLSGGTRSFLMAVLTGDCTWLVPSTREMFSITGIAHILALSGLHVGILSMVIYVLLFPLTAMGMRNIRMWVTVVALWAFAVLTGLSPSVVRAVIMATMFMLTAMMQRVWSPLNALCAAAMLILIVGPESVYSLGFQLTFIAVVSIIVFADRLNPFDYRRRWLRWAAGYVCVAVAAVLGTGVVSAYHFHQFPVYFALTNIVVSLMLPFVIGGGVVLLMLNTLGCKAEWLGRAVDMLYAVIEDIARVVGSMPGAVLRDVWLPGWTVAVYFVILGLLTVWIYRRRVVVLYAMAAVMLFAVVMWVLCRSDFPEREVYITRSSTETTMLIKDGHSLYAITTAQPGLARGVMTRDSVRYHEYMLRRGIDGIMPLVDGMYSTYTERKGNMVKAVGHSFVLIYDDRHVHGYRIRPNYAVVCRGFKGDIVDLWHTVHPDTILLSADLNRRRHDRYMLELTIDSIPHRSLRDKAFVLRDI